MELSQEERVIIEKWRQLGTWAKLELTKQNGTLYSMNSTEIERYRIEIQQLADEKR